MKLTGKRGIVLAEDLYEDLELWYPLLRLRGVGVEMQVVGTGSADVYKSKHGYPVKVDTTAESISSSEVDAVVIPGGYAPDRMRRYPGVVQLVRESFQKGKLVAAICHGGWLLASAGILKDRQVTSFFAIKDDLVNAGADWIDEQVVQDENLITSQTPGDLPAFTDAIIAALAGVESGDLESVTAETDALAALRLAVQAEEEAIRFYSEAVKRTEDPEAKNIFHQLAKEEERHRAIVQDEYRRLAADPEWDRYGIWREVL